MAQDPVTEEIRRRADIVEIVGQYVQLKPAGGDSLLRRHPGYRAVWGAGFSPLNGTFVAIERDFNTNRNGLKPALQTAR